MKFLLNRVETAALLSVSPTNFDRQVRGDPTFPQARNVTNTREGWRWVRSEVEEWIMSRKKAA